MATLKITIAPKLLRANGRATSAQIPLPKNKNATVTLTLDASSMTSETQRCKLGIEISNDGGDTWAEIAAIQAQGNVAASNTKGDPEHPWTQFTVSTGAGTLARGFIVVENGPFALGVDLEALWV